MLNGAWTDTQTEKLGKPGRIAPELELDNPGNKGTLSAVSLEKAQAIQTLPVSVAPGAELKPWRTLGGAALVGVLYFFTALAGIHYLSASNISVVWLPSGIALGMMIRLGWACWPGVLLGSLIFSLTVGSAWWVSAGVAVSNTLQPLAGYWLLRRYGAMENPFGSIRDLLRFLLLGGVAGPIVGACTALPFAGVGENWNLHGYLGGWLSWFLGDALGVVLVTPLILAWTGGVPVRLTRAKWVEAGFVVAVVAGIAAVIPLVYRWGGRPLVPLVFLLMPALVWGPLRFGPRGTTLVLFLSATTFLFDVGHHGGFLFSLAEPSRHWGLNITLLITALTTLLMLVVVVDRGRAEDQLRQTGARLRESEERLRLALEAAQMETWSWEIKTGQIEFSPDALRVLLPGGGRTIQGLHDWQDLVHAEDWPRLHQAIQQALRAETPSFCVEHRLADSSKETRWLECRGKVFCDVQGKPLRLVGTLGEITARKHAELSLHALNRKMEETQRLESIGVLAGGVAHDFNNLLTGILGNASLCRSDLPPTSPLGRYLVAIETASLRAAELCTQLLAYAGKGRFVVSRVNLTEMVQETLQLLRSSISKKAELRLELAANLPPVKGDASQLRQIIMNLAVNASEALGDHSGVITLVTGVCECQTSDFQDARFGQDAAKGTYAFFKISDTGCGIAPDMLLRIFDPFYTTKFTGRGLGLAAVSGIVRSHKAVLKVMSEPGRGTQFTLLLPVASGRIEAAKPTSSLPAACTGRVLIVDDEDMVRDTVAGMLRRAGFSVRLASDGREGIEILTRNDEQIDCVLLDLTMPKMDGVEVCNTLLRERPGSKVILMSGYSQEEAFGRLDSKVNVGFLQKPFAADVLVRKVSEVIAGS